tara:strand:+ start:351 stop:857 length:507 start_codon:yes stop_codon:yes gene_type:complete
MKDDTYYFHQTPPELCKLLVEKVPLKDGDKVLEPFKGEGSFYNALPDFIIKNWTEIEEGRDFKNYQGEIDWVITNPPFKLENEKGKLENSFYPLLDYYSTRVNKGIAFLGNDYCFSTLTPVRMKKINALGFYLQGYTICNVKKWRGRYFFMIFTKEYNKNINFIEGSF